ncbi:anthocyanidin 3-O-glucoside 5-O-glucosyltransferase 1-like [Miscanthus floridulus]|uniref:anthocyanidin 3-O-glucoside 5-O-glucosyltransferase 1-like n=1 Tax=Miscanthus floridulus TaxID=154761 RepID=UPI0034588105
MSSPRPHFLVLAYPLQGHIAPALRLARRLLAVAPDVLVTFSTTIAAHSRMSPAAKSTDDGECGAPEEDGRLEFHPFSDGTERGYAGGSDDVAEFNAYMVSGRPYLLVVRKDNRAMLAEEADTELELGERAKNGMVVEWCDQAHVLSHPAVGCFVTHCGWNSVLESVASGVPMVGVPKVSEQSTNARLVEREWRVGVRAQVDGGGVLRAAELRRCVEDVMGDETEVRRMAAEWNRVVAEAMGKGGSSYCNLMAFVDGARSRS